MYDKDTRIQFYEQPFFHKFSNIEYVNLSDDSPHYYNYLEFFAERRYDRWLNKNYDLVVDVGANVGLFTECMLKIYKVNKVISVECNGDLVKQLQQNFRRNTDVTIIPKALHYNNEPIVFYQIDENTGISTTIKPSNFSYTKEVIVPTITINDLVNTYGIIDLLKIDVEGAEYDVLLNTDDSVFSQINALFIECHFVNENSSQSIISIIDKLTNIGYNIEHVNLEQSKTFNGPPMIYAYK
jgi:FkbM family methyltransferase